MNDFVVPEDLALRDLLKGMAVTDNDNAGRAVGVWFGQPDMEITAQTYPYVTLDLVNISEARERVMNSAKISPWYYRYDLPTDLPTAPDGWEMPRPIPVNLDYQVTSYARHPRHDRQILGQILGPRLPLRYGSIAVSHFQTTVGQTVTDECTTRRLDMLSYSKRDTVESGKRLFMNVFTVRMSSEILSPFIANYFYKVKTIDVTVEAPYPSTLTSPDLITTFTITE